MPDLPLCGLQRRFLFIGNVFAQWITNRPKSALAVIILVSIIRLVKIKHMIRIWQFDGGAGITKLVAASGFRLSP
jgi:hypothetical protein